MLTVRHRLASGRDVAQYWEFDPARGALMASVAAGGAEPVEIELPVCSEAQPRHGAYALSRLDEQTFRVAPAAYQSEVGRGGQRILVAQPTPFHERLPLEFLLLTQAPHDVADELAELF